jgi:hypothetical protein
MMILVIGHNLKLIILVFLPTNDCKNPVPPVAYIPVQCAQLPTQLPNQYISTIYKYYV